MVNFKEERLAVFTLVFALVLVLFVFVFVNHVDKSSDSNSLTGNAVHPLYKGFASPVSGFPAVSAVVFSSGASSRILTFSANDDFIYRYAYVSINGSAWNRTSLTGGSSSGSWFFDSVSGSFSIPSSVVSVGDSSRNFIAVYSCSKSGLSWDCHDGWQIRAFKTTKSAGGGVDIVIDNPDLKHPGMFLNQQEINAIKSKVSSGSEPWKTAYAELISDANAELSKSYYSVTKNGGSPNKSAYYVVGGGYLWRCDENPCGAVCTGNEWVVCDGHLNTNADRSDYLEAVRVSNAVRSLALAYQLTNDSKYAEKAVYFINYWTVNSSTMMSPYYPYFQSRIELSITMPGMFYGADLLMNYPGWKSSDKQAFVEWTRQFGNSAMSWNETNNFEDCRNVVLFSVAVITENNTMMNYAAYNWKRVIPLHINQSGFMIKEINRADSLTYSIFAVNAMIIGAEIARHQGIDLYNYKDSRGIGLKNAVDNHAKYVANPSSWPLSQINAYKGADSAFYEIAYLWSANSSYLSAINKWGRPRDERWTMGPVTLTHAREAYDFSIASGSSFNYVSSNSVDVKNNAKIVSVWASDVELGTDNYPYKTLDGVLSENSRWAAFGNNQWIVYALNQTVNVSYVRFAFYSETKRYFDIQYSTNNITWYNTSAVNVVSAANKSSQYQLFNFSPVSARYIRFVGHGSSAPSLWNSIVETDINGFNVSLSSSYMTPASYCGDTICNGNENCSTCFGDCGACGGVVPNGSIKILYQNNFENQHTGLYYNLYDFLKDWNATAGGDRWYKAEVISGISGNPTQVLKIQYIFYNSSDFKYTCQGDDRCYNEKMERIEFSSKPPFGTSQFMNGVNTGAQWKINIPGNQKDLYLSYKIKFKEGFYPVDGGKLPGFCGGTCASGGMNTDSNGDGTSDGFSARLMFEKASNGYPISLRFYVYHPDRPATTKSTGDSVIFSKGVNDGEWHTIVQHAVMNDLNSNNGVLEAWLDGELVARRANFSFRQGSSANFDIDYVYFSTFFGGDKYRLCTDSQVVSGAYGCSRYGNGTNYYFYAPRKNETIYFDDIIVYMK